MTKKSIPLDTIELMQKREAEYLHLQKLAYCAGFEEGWEQGRESASKEIDISTLVDNSELDEKIVVLQQENDKLKADLNDVETEKQRIQSALFFLDSQIATVVSPEILAELKEKVVQMIDGSIE